MKKGISQNFQTVLLKKLPFAIQQEFPNEILQDIEMSVYIEHLKHSFVYQLRFFLYGNECEYKFPVSWWQALKEKHFRFLTKRWPVKYTTIKTVNVCPHINKKAERDHLMFVLYGDKP